jgi:hypothetical protein
MAGQLRIIVGLVQTVKAPFQCQVQIAGGMPLDDVVIRLWESAGINPLYEGRGGTTLDAAGNGLVAFDDIRLNGPCTARLVADDFTSSIPLRSDDAHIEVVP